MTKQEEIREGLGFLISRHRIGTADTSQDHTGIAVDNILSYLHSQGVVIKAECPDCEWIQFVGEGSVGMTPCYSCNSTGYVIEPLIKEE